MCKRCGQETWSPRSPYCRASRTATDYGEAHKALRARYARLVDAGQTICARCRRPIFPGEPWDLGHVDGDRSRYAGLSIDAVTATRAAAARRHRLE